MESTPLADAIVGVGFADCAVQVVLEHPKARQIKALAIDAGDFFWAEEYDDVMGSRVFVKHADGIEARIAEVPGAVVWIGVDSQNVYWTMTQYGEGPEALVRMQRP